MLARDQNSNGNAVAKNRIIVTIATNRYQVRS